MPLLAAPRSTPGRHSARNRFYAAARDRGRDQRRVVEFNALISPVERVYFTRRHFHFDSVFALLHNIPGLLPHHVRPF